MHNFILHYEFARINPKNGSLEGDMPIAKLCTILGSNLRWTTTKVSDRLYETCTLSSKSWSSCFIQMVLGPARAYRNTCTHNEEGDELLSVIPVSLSSVIMIPSVLQQQPQQQQEQQHCRVVSSTLFFYKNQEMSAEARMFLIWIHIFSNCQPTPTPKHMLKMLFLA